MTITEPQARESGLPVTPAARLAGLFDHGSLRVLNSAPGVCQAVGFVHGAPVVAFSTDPAVAGGALTGDVCTHIVAAYDEAVRRDCPIVGLWHSGGAHVGEGVDSLHGVGRMLATMTRASGRIPQLSLVLGPAAGGAAYGPALTDVIVLGPHGRVFVTGPDVVRSVTGEDVDMERLGGPEPHSCRSGVVHVTATTNSGAYETTRRLAALLGRQGVVGPVHDRTFTDLLPASPRRAYDVHPVVDALLDEPGVELHPRWARNMVTTLGRLGGRTVGVLANNPIRLAGCLDTMSAEKAARFVRMCDSLGIPLVVLVDVPGYLPGVNQEWDGVVRRGAKLLHAFAEAVVPRVTVLMRKAYGGAYIAMNSRALGADVVLAWPLAEVDVMGPVAAVRVQHRRQLAAAYPEDREALEEQLVRQHQRTVGGVSRAMQRGLVDAVIDPDVTRSAVAAVLLGLPDRRGKHGNIPL